METIEGILTLAVFLALGYGWYKFKQAASKAVTTKVLYRSEHKYAQLYKES